MSIFEYAVAFLKFKHMFSLSYKVHLFSKWITGKAKANLLGAEIDLISIKYAEWL